MSILKSPLKFFISKHSNVQKTLDLDITLAINMSINHKNLVFKLFIHA